MVYEAVIKCAPAGEIIGDHIGWKKTSLSFVHR